MLKEDVKAIMAELATVPDVITVELWNSQLNNEKDEKPIALPAVYVAFSTDWNKPTGAKQTGTTTVVLRVVDEIYQNGEVGSPKHAAVMSDFFDLPANVILAAEKCYLTLRSETIAGVFSNVKVHELTFEGIVERTRATAYTKKAAVLDIDKNILPD